MNDSQAEFDALPTRGRHYRLANEEMRLVRQNEIRLMLQKIQAEPGERIVDFGTGNGVLVYPLCAAVGSRGVVYAFDNSQEVLDTLLKDAGQANLRVGIVQPAKLPLEDCSVDAVASLACIHHLSDQEKGSTFREFARVLKTGGRLVIGDVAHGTAVQRYFDSAVDRFCSTGHKHPFLDEQWGKRLCTEGGLTLLEWRIEEVPWVFGSEREAAWFIHTLHDATCSPDECLSAAKQYLGSHASGDRFLLNWQLFYLIAAKERSSGG